MIISFTQKWAGESHHCAFDSDFLIAFDYIRGGSRTEIYLSTGHKISIPDESLENMSPAEFHRVLQADLIGRANKRLEQAGNVIAHTIAVQQYNRLVGEVMGVIKEAKEGDQEG